MSRYNHMFDCAFTVDSDKENPEDITVEELVAALQKRIEVIAQDGLEAFGHCDTFDNEASL